ncbi:MAG: nicotinate-nucleotide--dimethylbenzimidazole phosphoribosyltransferase [Endomicrobiales bacterium]|nr:nicotinate-nucleotide--dimethylbenzimidazole phosphoribosyltransferase [Endomicrobiales bacterium]
MDIPKISPVDRTIEPGIQQRIDSLTKPVGSLGRLEEIAKRVALIQKTVKPVMAKKSVYVFASDHGVAGSGVSAYPQEVTAEMVRNFLAGGAAINVFAKHTGTAVFVVDAGMKSDVGAKSGNYIVRKTGRSTKNFADEPAMSRKDAEAHVEMGFGLADKAKEDGVDIIAVGDMGIGNTTVAAAVCAACELQTESLIDIGTVIDSKTLKKKEKLVKQALKKHKPDPRDIVDVLSKVGGYCIAQMTGFMLKAASNSMPVVLDGFPVSSAALLACRAEPKAAEYMFAGHLSAVKGHKAVLDALKLEPILDLNMRLGEGTGGVLAVSVIEAAVKMMNEMATFEGAGVSKGKEDKNGIR